MTVDKDFKKGFYSWITTYYEMANNIQMSIGSGETDYKASRIQYFGGTKGLVYWAINLTDAFESSFKDCVWEEEEDFYDSVARFFHEHNIVKQN